MTVRDPSGGSVTIDGNVEMPGRGLPPERFSEVGAGPGTGAGVWEITTGYAGGTTTLVGHGTVGTPGALAAFAEASRRFGRLPWAVLFEPAIDLARRGFPLSAPARHYLEFVHDAIYGWSQESHAVVHRSDGSIIAEGDLIRIPALVATLERVAEVGAADLYTGDLAAVIAADSEANGGILTAADLAAYRVEVRPSLTVDLDGWQIATNPAPAVGGVTLAAMLLLLDGRPHGPWTSSDVAHLAAVQTAVLGERQSVLDVTDDVAAAAEELLGRAANRDLRRFLTAPSTVQTSAVDHEGLAVSVTASAGYGSGVMPSGTGFWMNNCLGELELNRRGLHALAPGTRLPSNMAPTVGVRRDGAVLAIGSPGADRITTAILHTLATLIGAGSSLADAVAHPRLHVDAGDDPTAHHEPGLPVGEVALPCVEAPGLAMYFGGVAAAMVEPGAAPVAAADPRRTGATATGGLSGR